MKGIIDWIDGMTWGQRFALIWFTLGVVLGIIAALHGHKLSGLGYFGAGLTAALAALGIGDMEPMVLVAGVLAALGAWGQVGFDSPLTNMDRQRAQQELFGAFYQFYQATGTSPVKPDVQALIFQGTWDCATQHQRDAATTVMDAEKALHEPAVATLVGGVTGADASPSSDDCLADYRRYRALNPKAFAQLEAQDPWLAEQL